MSDTVITVDSLSKAYQIGLKQRHGKTFREAFTDTLLSPFKRLRSIAGGGNGDGAAEETFWALKDVSFEVKRGEVVGIIGRNGAGKSTLLKILSQITEPTSGTVRMRGRVASLLEVGTGFHPELTGRENIYLNGAILGMKRAEISRKFDEIVAFAEVEKFLDTPVKRYSSGMYVRLAFAVAAHLEPEILIVDEVLAVGDAEFQKKCLGKMQEVAQGQGRTVLFVSHNMAAVRSLCSRALVMSHGRAVHVGTVMDAITKYLQPEVPEDNQDEYSAGPFSILKVAIQPENRPDIATFESLLITVDVLAKRPCGQVGINLYIESKQGDRISGITGVDLATGRAEREGAVIRFSFRIASLPFIQGTYWLVVEAVDQTAWQEWQVPHRYSFSVEPTILYGTRTSSPLHHGLIGLQTSLQVSMSSIRVSYPGPA